MLAKYEPNKENIIPLTIIGIPTLKSTNLFLMCIISAVSAIGINTSKFMACALFCLKDKKIVRIGMSNVPPPIPIPPTIPLASPATNNQIKFILIALFLQQL